jgi:Sulfotransferase family
VETSRFEELYERRTQDYAKDVSDEAFLAELNAYLEPRELALYEDRPIELPFVFVLGAPRSGTTIASQLLAYCLDVGYITNFAARFWRAPVHGIRLSRLIAGEPHDVPFASDYARTPSPQGIHEFGYFWRGRLRKESFDEIVRAPELEPEIDWDGLRLTLANVQHEFGRPVAGKNVLSAFHMPKLLDVLGRVLWVLIERDPLDAAVSILDARRRYYSDDLDTWWSYVPPEYPLLETLGYWEQIAGQVHYLGRFYERSLAEVPDEVAVRITYEQLCRDPASVLDAVMKRAASTYDCRIELRKPPPASFQFRTYTDRDDEKETFARHFGAFAAKTG